MRSVDLKEYGISRYAYRELKAFCLQYPEKKRAAADMLSVSSPAMSGMPSAHSDVSPVERAAERRERLLDDVRLIERCARETAGGRYYAALIRNCCMGVPFDCISPEELPSSDRNRYFRARREFFWRLWASKNNISS